MRPTSPNPSEPPPAPPDNVLRRMQLDWAPERAATVGVAAGATFAVLWTGLILLDRLGRIGFTFQAGHNMAVGALAAVLAGLTMLRPRAAAAGYAAWTAAYALLLPVLLANLDAAVGVPEAIAYGLVLVQVSAVWALVAALLFVFKAWLLRWVEKRLALQAAS